MTATLKLLLLLLQFCSGMNENPWFESSFVKRRDKVHNDYFDKILQPKNGMSVRTKPADEEKTDVDLLAENLLEGGVTTPDCIMSDTIGEKVPSGGAERTQSTQAKKRKRTKSTSNKSQTNFVDLDDERNEIKEDYEFSKKFQMQKSEKAFGGHLLFCNVGEKRRGKIKAAHWRNEYIIHHLNVRCNLKKWKFKTDKEAKEALEVYVYRLNLKMERNLWIPTSVGSVVEKYETEKKAEQIKKDVDNKTQGKAAKSKNVKIKTETKVDEIMNRKLKLLEKNRNSSSQNLNIHEESTSSEKINSDESDDLTKVNKSIASELLLLRENFPNETASRQEKDQQKNSISNDILVLKKHFPENQYKWSVSHKNSKLAAEQKVLESPLTSFHLSEKIEARRFDLSANIGETIILAKNPKDVILQEIENVGENTIIRALNGVDKGKTNNILWNDKIMQVIYNFEELGTDEELGELFILKKAEIQNMKETLEKNLLKVCVQLERDDFCAKKIKEWKILSQNEDYKDNMLLLNEQLFYAEMKRRKTSDLNDTIADKINESNAEQNKNWESNRILWLEIKAQSFGEQFASYMTRKSNAALKYGHHQKHLHKMMSVYNTGLELKHLTKRRNQKNKMITEGTKPSPKLFKNDIAKDVYSLSTDYDSSKMKMIDSQWRELRELKPKKLLKLYNMSPNASELVAKRYDPNARFDFQGAGNFEAVGINVDDMTTIEQNVVEYVNSFERDGMPKSKVQSSESHSAGAGNGAFAADEIQKYEVVGIWSGDLFSKKYDDALFHLGGSKAERNAYIVELSKNADDDNEFILDPKDPHGLVNDCQNWKNFRNAMTTLNDEEIKRFNLGWLEFKYKGIPYMAEIALRKIPNGNTELSTAPTSAQLSPVHSGSGESTGKPRPDSELFTSYGPAYIPALLDDHAKDGKNREKIITNMKKEVKNILGKSIR